MIIGQTNDPVAQAAPVKAPPAATPPAADGSTAAADSASINVSDSARLMARADDSTTLPAATGEGNTEEGPVESFVYGALGLDRPSEQQKSENGYYSAGKWLAAAATVGTIVSLLV
ncbi:MAG: hypothetical protein CGU28_12515 [Candidatus Dactylopiibacterium carminicum]|uniref:Uncharacterized protein n=1 Tax=Candidatus Dactylopiibacterium carminicum TaxID=857335 RepID=A0A272EPR4_9RHOO|nr:hypothetical protein [Candidatus Dactylopiibacterium carminicum]KAF7598502.1 hypothetical protein BGI27_13070 [Candidatus Dactylopiibacterium carminicum]PAS92097.1 MAG: hypothetical protein CGU29_13190 [Candidatus Dactylopiibacterium carminicum]PAS95519.1 MAG: hypothetical protein CGU28_12515 [Candidatus Dactylopiibacterium carminicum]PAS97901.1 MAG: hypothetical protein BSR46_13090 [Candidatus Dactylopiibacterium carminicum]